MTDQRPTEIATDNESAAASRTVAAHPDLTAPDDPGDGWPEADQEPATEDGSLEGLASDDPEARGE
jgi:hypothetical protein